MSADTVLSIHSLIFSSRHLHTTFLSYPTDNISDTLYLQPFWSSYTPIYPCMFGVYLLSWDFLLDFSLFSLLAHEFHLVQLFTSSFYHNTFRHCFLGGISGFSGGISFSPYHCPCRIYNSNLVSH